MFRGSKKSHQDRHFLLAVFLFAWSLAGCAETPIQLERFAHPDETPESFYICRGYGCRHKSYVQLTEADWSQVAMVFASVQTAEQEREAVATGVAALENIVGEKAGTYRDVAGATIRGHGPYQLDCIDETINTSLYIQFFADKGWLKFHEIVTPARRGAFIDGEWPHNTAVIRVKSSHESYAIDSWYGKNGEAADIVPLDEWLAGWRRME